MLCQRVSMRVEVCQCVFQFAGACPRAGTGQANLQKYATTLNKQQLVSLLQRANPDKAAATRSWSAGSLGARWSAEDFVDTLQALLPSDGSSLSAGGEPGAYRQSPRHTGTSVCVCVRARAHHQHTRKTQRSRAHKAHTHARVLLPRHRRHAVFHGASHWQLPAE